MSVLPSGPEWTPSSTVNTPDAGFIMFFQNATKDHKSVLLKQKEDIGYLSRHLDHVISFAELATARNQSIAFLHCKRLVRLPRSFISSVESWHNSVTKVGAYGSDARVSQSENYSYPPFCCRLCFRWETCYRQSARHHLCHRASYTFRVDPLPPLTWVRNTVSVLLELLWNFNG